VGRWRVRSAGCDGTAHRSLRSVTARGFAQDLIALVSPNTNAASESRRSLHTSSLDVLDANVCSVTQRSKPRFIFGILTIGEGYVSRWHGNTRLSIGTCAI
jgi:hypothetical protein